MFWHRAPREVYRVYGQDEYLAQEEAQAIDERSAPPSAGAARGSRSGGLVGLGLLLSITLGVLGLLVLDLVHGRNGGARPVVAAQGAQKAATGRSPLTHHTSAGAQVSRITLHGEAAVVTPVPALHASTPTSARPNTSTTPDSRVVAPMRSVMRSPGLPVTHSQSLAEPSVQPLRRAGLTAGDGEEAGRVGASISWGGREAVSQLAVPGTETAALDGEFGFER